MRHSGQLACQWHLAARLTARVFDSSLQTSDGKLIACSSDKKIRVIEKSEVAVELAGSVAFTQLALPQLHILQKDRLLFAGTENGMRDHLSLI